MDAPFASVVRKKVEGLETAALMVMSRVAKGYSDQEIQDGFELAESTFRSHFQTILVTFGLEELSPSEQRESIKELYELQMHFAFGNRFDAPKKTRASAAKRGA